jgi:hypothetical protein
MKQELLEQLLSRGYTEIGKTKDQEWIFLQNEKECIIYDLKLNKPVGRYTLEHIQNGCKGY